MTQNEEWNELATFFRRSCYDVIQVREEDGWGRPWTFPACDVHAAERVGRQMRRVYGTDARLRHSRKARLSMGSGQQVEAVILTELPSLDQVVFSLATGTGLRLKRKVIDEVVQALVAATAPRP